MQFLLLPALLVLMSNACVSGAGELRADPAGPTAAQPAPAPAPPAAPAPQSGVRSGPSMEYDPQIITTLLQLLDVKDNTRPGNSDFTDTSLKDILTLGTPTGFHLRNRYTHLGVSLTQALAAADDPRLKDQLIELARWERSPEIRAVGLITLAARKDAAHLKFFHEGLINVQPEVRFGALEALEIWNLPEAKDEFKYVVRTDLSPVVQIYAAQALARRGDEAGLELLRRLLDSGDWLARAMSARYLGDVGTGEDYERVLDRMAKDQATNDFVTAECAIAAMKLFPKKEATSPTTAPPPPPPPAPASVAAGEFELDPLVITAPRLKIPATLSIDGRVNAQLLRLLQEKANSRPTAEDLNDPSVKALNSLSSPVGFLLKIRYTELGFLLTEGLAGTADLALRNQIQTVARSGTSPQTRAAALVAIAYNTDPADRGLFQEALLSQDITVRWGAVEALQIWGQPDAMADVGNAARGDLSLPLQIYAAQMMLKAGDDGGRDILIRRFEDQDWLARAMANRYLGDMGAADDFGRILTDLNREQNNFVKAEMCGALLRLNKLRTK